MKWATFVGPFLGGVLFALGLGFSGMTQPHVVKGFLDLFGEWNPRLLFVMGGAVVVSGGGFFFQKKMPRPFFSQDFQIPTLRTIDWKLLTGAAIFGTGWGLAGFCPGPALTSLATLQTPIFVFVAAMAMGILLQRKLIR